MKRSAQKRDRQSKERRMRNRQTKSTFRTAIKKFDAACTAGNKEEALANLTLSSKLLDTAAGKGIIHPNTAARKKSRMSHKYNSLA